MSTEDLTKAKAIIDILGENCPWYGVKIARLFVKLKKEDQKEAILLAKKINIGTNKRINEIINEFNTKGFMNLIQDRNIENAAKNVIIKLFPAAIAEGHFLDRLSNIKINTESKEIFDFKSVVNDHSTVDFIIETRGKSLPINVKCSGIRFEKSKKIVDLETEDCIPIPAYKIHQALKQHHNLLYVVCIDYDIVRQWENIASGIFSEDENIVWNIIVQKSGSKIKEAEDAFVKRIIAKNWNHIRNVIPPQSFYAISAIKALSILKENPIRTPGMKIKSWGTTARGEINVHISIKEETTSWELLEKHIIEDGIDKILSKIDNKITRSIPDPLL